MVPAIIPTATRSQFIHSGGRTSLAQTYASRRRSNLGADGKPVVNKWKEMGDIPAVTPLAERISKDMKQRGFKFVGPTIIYAHLQAAGLVNDHVVSCPRHKQVQELVR